MTDDNQNLLDQVERDFCFLMDDHAFVAMPPQRSGDMTMVRYEHPHLVIQRSTLLSFFFPRSPVNQRLRVIDNP